MPLSRRQLLFKAIWGTPLLLSEAAHAQVSSSEALVTPPDAWAEILNIAKSFVKRQRRTRPFAPNSTIYSRSGRAVFIDYFPSMPLSFHNIPAERDSYETIMLRRESYNKRFASVGGFISERPLAVEVWQSPFWRQINLAIDILRAAEIGADGFVVDILRLQPDPAWSIITTLYDAAAHADVGFSIVPEIDHGGIPDCTSEQIVRALTALTEHPAAYRLDDGRSLVTAFAPERRPAELWRDVTSAMTATHHPIAFLPVFLNTSTAGDFAPFAYGFSTWGERDPLSIEASASQSRLRRLSKGSQIWMQPIAPQDVRPKVANFWEAGGSDAYRAGWEKAIKTDAKYVHIITWNDFSEATEIEPSTGTQFVFYDLTAYFIEYFKYNRLPAIRYDSFYYLYRQMIISLDQVRPGSTFNLQGRTPLRNTIECISFLTEPASVEIKIGSSTHINKADKGLQISSVDAQQGRPSFRITRNGKLILSKEGEWPIYPEGLPILPLYVGGSDRYPLAR